MELDVFNTRLEVYEFKSGEFPKKNSTIFFKLKGRNEIRTGYVLYFKTRAPKIRVDTGYATYEEFANIEWWDNILTNGVDIDEDDD